MVKFEFGNLVQVSFSGFEDGSDPDWEESEIPIQHTHRAMGGLAVDANTFRQNVVDQFDQAYQAFGVTVEMLNATRAASDTVTDAIEVPERRIILPELEPWLTDAKVDYAVADINAHPGADYQLIATPNILATPQEVTSAMRQLAERVSENPQVPEGVLDAYSAEEVSGTQPENGNFAKFKLVRDLPNDHMYADGHTQRQKLSELRINYPFLEATTPLEDLVFLNALRANGLRFGGRGNYHPILLRRSFMMRPSPFKSLPCSYVSVHGDLTMIPDAATSPRDGYISIG